MPSYSAIERLERIMRYLNNTDLQRRTSFEVIAIETGIPYPSVRKTISYDYPQCFVVNPYGGWKLSDPVVFPEGVTFELSPIHPVGKESNRVAKIKPERFDEAIRDIMSNKALGLPRYEALTTMLATAATGDKVNMNQYWKEYNMARAWTAMLQAIQSPDILKKLSELVEKFDTTAVYKQMTKGN